MEVNLLLPLLLLSIPGHCFRWELDQVMHSGRTLTLSEGYMFASGQGPSLSSLIANADSSITLSAVFTTYSTANTSGTVSYVIYGKDLGQEMNALDGGSWELQGQCDAPSSEELSNWNSWTIGIESNVYTTEYVGTIAASDPLVAFLNTTFDDDYSYSYSSGYGSVYNDANNDNILNDNFRRRLTERSYFVYRTTINHAYVVNEVAWYGGTLKACDSSVLFATVFGEVTFKNPYGFIPAEYFGLLPFEMARLVALIALTMFFAVSCLVYASNLLPLHSGILAACFVAVIDGIFSLIAYAMINASGQPDCCPYASPIIATLIVQIFRQTVSRVLLLVVALGYGIARPSLSRNEWVGLFVLASAYLTCNLVAEFSEVRFEKSNPYGVPASSAYLGVELLLALFTDALFLTWIFQALNSTTRVLTEFKQTYKLELYQNITNIIIAFTILFLLFLVLLSLDLNGLLGFPWQMSWVQLVIWEVLNFAVLAAICIVCRPNQNSLLLSYASQLPTSEDDDLADDGRTDQLNDFDNEDIILPQSEKPPSEGAFSGRTFSAGTMNPITMNLRSQPTKGKARAKRTVAEESTTDELEFDWLPSAPTR